MTGCSPLSWLVRAHGGGRGIRDKQLALVVADAGTLGREEDARQGARPGRGSFAQAGAGGAHVTGSSRTLWPVRARRGGRGTRDMQLAPVVAGACTPGRERDT